MRITGGTARGLSLAPVGRGDEAARLRPTPDRVREALFSILASRGALEGARVLDLFAGTGALGLEALSRGAAEAVLVDDGRAAARLIAANLDRTGLPARHLRADATRLPPRSGAPFDLILLDPPYGRGLGAGALAAARAGSWIAPGAIVAWEEDAPQPPPPGFRPLDTRRYGTTFLTLIEAEDRP
ncbi:MAG: 16S rRNA (guanine(966)-N(2))-methyltransferase RsmD [Hasllibacter sp.]